jgi:PIN domain nuclease of toxin-antitoxin system
MAYLLDTHTFLWMLDGSDRLPEKIRMIVTSKSNTCFLSIASLWEITIKEQLGKLKLDISLDDIILYMQSNSVEIIAINHLHLKALQSLEFINRDPFDRLIVAQAKTENLTLLTADIQLSKYPIRTFWQ